MWGPGVKRVAATTHLSSVRGLGGVARVGLACSDITPDGSLPMAGYSGEGKDGAPGHDRLFARVFFFGDARGEPLVICALDLWCGASFLVAAVAERLEEIGADRLLIVGTHTHSAPGNYLGNVFYDALGSAGPGFDARWAGWLTGVIANTIREARARARPARLRWGTAERWGVSRNRSLDAFLENDSLDAWVAPGELGENAPATASPQQKAIDPRVTTLTVVGSNDRILGVLGMFGCHATALGPTQRGYARDWPGYAVDEVEQRLAKAGHPGVVAAFVPSAAGDVSPLPPDDRVGTWRGPPELDSPDPAVAQGISLARWVGREIGATAAACAEAEAARATGDWRVEGRFRPWLPMATPDPAAPIRSWAVGWPLLGGAEDARAPAHRLGIAVEGMRSHHFDEAGRDGLQSPKSPALGTMQGRLKRFLPALKPSAWHALHVVKLGGMVLATVPGEPTTVMAREVERALAREVGGPARIVGFCGDYAGYFTTEAEYRLQHYEGAHTLYGKKSALHLQRRLVELLRHLVAGTAVPDLPAELVCRSMSGHWLRLLWWRLTRGGDDAVALPGATVARLARTEPSTEVAVPVLGPGFESPGLPRHRNLYLTEARPRG